MALYATWSLGGTKGLKRQLIRAKLNLLATVAACDLPREYLERKFLHRRGYCGVNMAL